ncbi:uncharacterized protein, partial [Bemisia tabaci]|uniref:uncharacterized protein n=1 Tax=Bemisia tabaci TaxID=7038 RepID=UPI003B27FEEB
MSLQTFCTSFGALLLLAMTQRTSGITNERPQPIQDTASARNSTFADNKVESGGHRSLLDAANWPHVRHQQQTPRWLSDEPTSGRRSTSGKRAAPPEMDAEHFLSESPMDSDLEPDDDLSSGSLTGGLTVHKCCPFGEQLEHPSKKCIPLPEEPPGAVTETQYSEPENASSGTEIPDWLPPNLRVGEVYLQSKPADLVLFNFAQRKPECPFPDVVPIDDLNLSSSGDLLSRSANGGRLSFSSQDFCVDRIHVKDVNLTDVSADFHAVILCPCNDGGAFCVNKCCGVEDVMQIDEELRCVPTTASKDDLMAALREATLNEVPNKAARPFYLRESYIPRCEHGAYLLKNALKKNGINNSPAKFWLKTDGHIKLSDLNVEVRNTDYCLDMVNVNNKKELQMIGCRRANVGSLNLKSGFHEILYKMYYTSGAIFLGLTLLVHLLRPELRKSLHSYNFIAHNANLFVAYLILTFAHLSQLSSDPIVCPVLGFATQFFFLSTFFWLSVICFDISSAFGVLVPKINSHTSLKFVKYGAFAWGMASIMTGLTAVAEYTPFLGANSSFKPNFGVNTCWFKEKKGAAVFFYGPIGVMLVLNLIQFLATVRRITAARRDTRVLRNSPEHQNVTSSTRGEKHWLLLYGKLFCLMGGTWLFEVVSWVLEGPSYLWYLPDGINALRGAGIFFIFLWQRKFFRNFSLSLHHSSNQPTTTSANSNGSAGKKKGSLTTVRTSSIQLSNINGCVKHKTSLTNVNDNKAGPT